MTPTPPFNCVCDEGFINSECLVHGQDVVVFPITEPKSLYEECIKLSNELEVLGNKKLDDDLTERITTPPVEGEWEEELMKIAFFEGSITAKNVRKYFVPFITTLLHTERESAMLRQRNYDQTLIEKARAEERERIVKMIDDLIEDGWSNFGKREALSSLRDKITNNI